MMEPTANELHARLPRQRQRDVDVPRALRALRAPVARRQRDRARGRRRRSRSPPIRPAPHAFEGLEFREVASVTRIAGGIADNVIPDRVECAAELPLRARAQSPREAEARLAELCGGHGELRIDSNAPSGAVALGQPTRRTRWPPRAAWRVAPKQAWTPVAEFAARRAGRGQLRAGRPRAGAPARGVGRGRARSCARYRVLEALAAVKLSPVLEGMRDLPVRAPRPRPSGGCRARGVELVDFGMGEPREETPAFIREALAAALEPLSTYPLAEGLPELRAAIAGWIARRFGARAGPGHAGHPDARLQGGDLPPRPGGRRRRRRRHHARLSGVRARRAVRRHARASSCRCDAERASCPTSTRSTPHLGPRRPAVAQLPEQPDRRRRRRSGSTSGRPSSRAAHDFVLASDEAYSELYFGDEPPASALQLADLHQRRGAQHALQALARCPATARASWPATRSWSPRSSATGPTSASRRRSSSSAPPVAAWGDEAHVEEVRAGYRAKRDVLLPALEAAGLRHAGGDATFFLWLDAGERRGGRRRAAARARDRASRPGSFFGAGGAALPAARARADARGVPARGRAARARVLRPASVHRALLLVRVQRRVQAAPRAAARQRLDRAASASCAGTAGRRRPRARAP